MTDIRARIYGIQCQQMPSTIEEGKEKAERGAKCIKVDVFTDDGQTTLDYVGRVV